MSVQFPVTASKQTHSNISDFLNGKLRCLLLTSLRTYMTILVRSGLAPLSPGSGLPNRHEAPTGEAKGQTEEYFHERIFKMKVELGPESCSYNRFLSKSIWELVLQVQCFAAVTRNKSSVAMDLSISTFQNPPQWSHLIDCKEQLSTTMQEQITTPSWLQGQWE